MNRTFALVLVVLIAGCRAGKDQPEPTKVGNGVSLSAASSQYIGIAVAESEGTALEVSLPARVAFRPEAVASLGAPVTGRIVAVSVRPGDSVRAGAPLVTLQSA